MLNLMCYILTSPPSTSTYIRDSSPHHGSERWYWREPQLYSCHDVMCSPKNQQRIDHSLSSAVFSNRHQKTHQHCNTHTPGAVRCCCCCLGHHWAKLPESLVHADSNCSPETLSHPPLGSLLSQWHSCQWYWGMQPFTWTAFPCGVLAWS